MRSSTATTRAVVAAGAAVLFAMPAAAFASDGTAGSDEGGGATYQSDSRADGPISLRVASGAWVGRATRVRGKSAADAGRMIAIERRRAGSRRWVSVASARVERDGTFATSWKPARTGRHELRAVSTAASSAADSASTASSAERVTVYRGVIATWYGPGFYGNRTACGQRLTTRTLGVAHRTLPCGTRVALRVSGRTIVVPVIDRGPYANGATYDLTSATARRVGMNGTTRIGAAVLAR